MKVPKQISIERQQQAWSLRLQGWTYEKIAEKLEISHQAVAKILNRVTRKYRERHLEEVDRIKAEQVAQLEQVGFEAYQAWERSKDDAKLIRQKKSIITENGKTITLPGGEQTIDVRDQDGDPRYLQVYMKSKEDIRKIIGADAPTKSEITGKNGESLTIEGRVDHIASLFEQARARRDSATSCVDRERDGEVETTTRSTDSGVL